MEPNQCIFEDYLHLCEPVRELFHSLLFASEAKLKKVKEL